MIITMKLREVRENKKMNMHQLSLLSGVSYSAVWKIENENRTPSLIVLCKLAEALDVEPQDLFAYKTR